MSGYGGHHSRRDGTGGDVGDIRYLKQYVPGECGKELMGAKRTEITSGKWAGVGDIRYLKQYVPGECGKELMGAERTEITSG